MFGDWGPQQGGGHSNVVATARQPPPWDVTAASGKTRGQASCGWFCSVFLPPACLPRTWSGLTRSVRAKHHPQSGLVRLPQQPIDVQARCRGSWRVRDKSDILMPPHMELVIGLARCMLFLACVTGHAAPRHEKATASRFQASLCPGHACRHLWLKQGVQSTRTVRTCRREKGASASRSSPRA